MHENLKKSEALLRIDQWLREDFRQLQLESGKGTVNALSSKKGKITVKEEEKQMYRKHLQDRRGREGRSFLIIEKKKYILEAGKPVDFLSLIWAL